MIIELIIYGVFLGDISTNQISIVRQPSLDACIKEAEVLNTTSRYFATCYVKNEVKV